MAAVGVLSRSRTSCGSCALVKRHRWLCVETIDQAISDPAVALTRPARRRRGRRRLLGLPRRGRLTALRMMQERPWEAEGRLRAGHWRPRVGCGPVTGGRGSAAGRSLEAEGRLQAGHWAGDLIRGLGLRSAIGTLLERRPRFLVLLGCLHGIATAQAVRQGIAAAARGLPAGLRRTLTWDHGTELALHPPIAAAPRIDLFFCDALARWQRGSGAAGQRREHERIAARLPPQRHRPQRPHLQRSGARRRRSQRPPPHNAGLVSAAEPVHPPGIRLTQPHTTGRIMKNTTSPPALSAFL